MSISSEISRLSGNVSDALDAIEAKGVTVPSGSNSDDLATLIAQISGGGTGAISIVDTADAAGGTVRTITALDISDTTAAAGDVVSGKYFYTADGTKTQGSIATKTSSDLAASTLTVTAPAGYYASAASKTLTDNNLSAGNIKKDISIFGVTGSYEGSGGGGLVYETGTWTPTANIADTTISFTNAHTTVPFHVLMFDTSTTAPGAANYNIYMSFLCFYGLGYTVQRSSSSTLYCRAAWGYTTSNSDSSSGLNITALTPSTNNAALDYWLTTSTFKAYTNSTSRYWKSGRTYKWIAVWAPTT